MLESRKKANAKWDKENMTNLACRLRKDKAEQFKAICRARGTTPNAEFMKVIDKFIAEESPEE